jgi:hypothetical protein
MLSKLPVTVRRNVCVIRQSIEITLTEVERDDSLLITYMNATPKDNKEDTYFITGDQGVNDGRAVLSQYFLVTDRTLSGHTDLCQKVGGHKIQASPVAAKKSLLAGSYLCFGKR